MFHKGFRGEKKSIVSHEKFKADETDIKILYSNEGTVVYPPGELQRFPKHVRLKIRDSSTANQKLLRLLPLPLWGDVAGDGEPVCLVSVKLVSSLFKSGCWCFGDYTKATISIRYEISHKISHTSTFRPRGCT
jgi:hypothetical protein